MTKTTKQAVPQPANLPLLSAGQMPVGNGRIVPATTPLSSKELLPEIVGELQNLQRQRVIILKSRNMAANRLRAVVAGRVFDYTSGMAQKERAGVFKKAQEFIVRVDKGEETHELGPIIVASRASIVQFEKLKDELEERQLEWARKLPDWVLAWLHHQEQTGFGLHSLAVIIGEAGNLSNYQTPEGHSGFWKLWRRMGCAPWEFEGKTHTGGAWRRGKYGKLPADQWSEYGYSPRRRSVMYVIGDVLIKSNFVGKKRKRAGEVSGDVLLDTDLVCAGIPGPYRSRYEEKKLQFQTDHPDYTKMQCHLHGMLLASKLLLKRLWQVWNQPRSQRVL